MEDTDEVYSERETSNAVREVGEMKWAFAEFIKPVLDAAAVDFELRADLVALGA